MKIFTPQKNYTWFMILFSLFFVGFGLWSLVRYQTVSAWPLTVACVLLTMILILWSFPNSSYLLLDETGLRIRHLFSTTNLRWEDIQKFWVDRRITGQLGVYYLLNGNRLMQVHYLPDNYGMNPRELAIVLNQWRTRMNSLDSNTASSASAPKRKWRNHSTEQSGSYALGMSNTG